MEVTSPLTPVRYIGKILKDADGNLIPHYKDGYRFDADGDYVNYIPIERANRWVGRWPEIYKLLREKDNDAETVIAQLMNRIKELELALTENAGKEIVETPRPKGRPKKSKVEAEVSV